MKMNRITDRVEANKIISSASRKYTAANKRMKVKPNAVDRFKRQINKLKIIATGGQINRSTFPEEYLMARAEKRHPGFTKRWQSKRDAAQKEYDQIVAAFLKDIGQ